MSQPAVSRSMAPAVSEEARLWSVGPAAAPPAKGGQRRKMMLVLALAILSQYSLDVLVAGPGVWMLVIRLVWALGIVGSARLYLEFPVGGR